LDIFSDFSENFFTLSIKSGC